MHYLAICGSLRAMSSNMAVLQACALLAVPDSVTFYDGLADIPAYNPDLDTDTPPTIVADLREAIANAHALLISSPEYAHGIAGSLKNALDWLVSSPVLVGKPIGVINANPHATYAHPQLVEVLRTASAQVPDDAAITLPYSVRGMDAAQIVQDTTLAKPIGDMLELLTHIVADAKSNLHSL